MNAKNRPGPRPRRRARLSDSLETRFAFRMSVSPLQSEKVETDDAKNALRTNERIAEELHITGSAVQSPAIGSSPGGSFDLYVEAEELLWQVLKRPKCGLDTVPVEDLEAALREDLKISLAPSIVMRIYALRLLLEQGGGNGECPQRWTAEQWKRWSDPTTIAAELGRLTDAIALRPFRSGRSGHPRMPRALTKRWDGFPKLKEELASLLKEAYWQARSEKAITPGSAPDFHQLFDWVEDSPVLRDRVASIPDFESRAPFPWVFMLAKRLEKLARHGYSAQRIPLFAAHWATELRTGIIGSPLSETKGHRLKRGK